MATITSVGSGLWSAAGTWDFGVPADNDKVIIASGHTVTFDVDQSAWVTGVDGITITGTLEFSRLPGTYFLMIKTNQAIAGAGVFDCGTSLDPIPFTAKHTISGSGFYLEGNSGLSVSVYGAEPTYIFARLTDGETGGTTVLRVDTDLTGDIWADGDEVSIVNINKGRNYDERTIAVGGIAAGTITITAGLGSAKIAGAYVVLKTRHIRFVGGAGTKTFNRFSGSSIDIHSGEFPGRARTFENCNGITIDGGVYYNQSTALLNWDCVNVTINNIIELHYTLANAGSNLTFNDGYVFAAYWIMYRTDGSTINGGLFAGCAPAEGGMGHAVFGGTFIGNLGIFTMAPVEFYGGTFNGNGKLITRGYGILRNITCSGNTQEVERAAFKAFNSQFTGLELSGREYYSIGNYSESIDHNQVPGAFKAWTAGGITTKQAVIYPTGFTSAMHTVLDSADSPGYWQREVTVAPGQSVDLDIWLRKDAAMGYLPRMHAFLKHEADPLVGGTPLFDDTMTNSIDTWEGFTHSYSNNTAEDIVLVIRFQGKNATGNLYSALTVQIINVDLTSVLAHLVDIKGLGWVDESLVSLTADHALLATSAELAALNDLDAADIRAAIGLATANIDQQFLNTISWQAINLDESITAGTIIQIRGNSWVIPIDDLVLSANKQQFAIKCTLRNAALNQCPTPRPSTIPDADSVVFIDSDTGLLYVNGVAAADPTLGSLAYVGTTLTVTLDPTITAQLSPGIYTFGIQSIDPAGLVSEPYGGTFTITADVVRSIT